MPPALDSGNSTKIELITTASIDVSRGEAALRVTWSDGHVSTYGWLWLRDCCGCELSSADGTSQRLTELARLPKAPRADAIARQRNELVVSWEPDDHESRYGLAWLRANCGCGEHELDESPPRVKWRSGSHGVPLRRSLHQVQTDDGALKAWLGAVSETGIAVLSEASSDPGTVARVVDLFGHVRETNYGRIFDVVTTVDPRNLAFTSLPLGPHTDNPYRRPVPTLQLLHCLVSSTTGGDSIFVDGLEAAAVMSREDPDAYALLANLPVPWRYADDSTELVCQAPVIGLEVAGRVEAIRFNERARVPSRFRADVAAAHLEALRNFAVILKRRSAAAAPPRAGRGRLLRQPPRSAWSDRVRLRRRASPARLLR